MTLLCAALGAATALSCVYRLTTLCAAWKHLRRRHECGRHVAQASRLHSPPRSQASAEPNGPPVAQASRLHLPRVETVTVVKPLCGTEHGLMDNLTAVLQQDYPAYRTVFCAADPDDPALTAARQAIAACPNADAAIVSGNAPDCPNRKVANMMQASAHMVGSVIVIGDSDTRPSADWLRRVVSPFADPKVGGVTCLYRLTEAQGMAARMEGLYVGVDFIPGVLVATELLGADFGSGATLAVRREALDASGGFAALCDEIADDHRLVQTVRSQGMRVELSDVIVDCPIGRIGWRDSISRRIRWTRTVRSLQPLGYLGYFITHSIPIATVLALTCRTAPAALALAATVALRVVAAHAIARHVTDDREALRSLWILPIADFLSAAVWAVGLMGSRITWRGRQARVR